MAERLTGKVADKLAVSEDSDWAFILQRREVAEELIADRCVDGTGEVIGEGAQPTLTDRGNKQTTQTRQEGRGNRGKNKGQTLQILTSEKHLKE